MICPNCGGTINDNAVFCRACGYRMPEQPTAYPEGTVYAGNRPTQPQQPYQPQPQPQYEQPYQPQYQQPQYLQAGYTTPPPKKSKTAIIVVLVILVLVGVIIGLIAVLVGGGDDSGSSKKSKKTSSSASADDGGDVVKPGGTDDPIPGSSSTFVGTWQSSVWIYDGNTYYASDPNYGEVVKAMMTLKLNSDGTGTCTINGTTGSCTWKDYGNGIIVDDGQDETEFPLSNGMLVFTVEESIVYLDKISGQAV